MLNKSPSAALYEVVYQQLPQEKGRETQLVLLTLKLRPTTPQPDFEFTFSEVSKCGFTDCSSQKVQSQDVLLFFKAL